MWFPTEITGRIEGHSPMGYKQRKWEVDQWIHFRISLWHDFPQGPHSKKMNIQRGVLSLCIKPTRGEPLKRLWKGFQCSSHPDSTPWDMPALLLRLKCLIKHSLSLGNYRRVWEWLRAWNGDRRRRIPPPDFFFINEAPPRTLKVMLPTNKVFKEIDIFKYIIHTCCNINYSSCFQGQLLLT